LLELAVILTTDLTGAKPRLMPVSVRDSDELPSTKLRLGMGSSVGATLVSRIGGVVTRMGATVTVKVWLIMLLLAAPLLTVTVMVAAPKAPATGANVTVPVLFGLV